MCEVEGCTDRARKLGLCNKHYARIRRHGDPHRGSATPEERFWPRVDKDGPVPACRPDLGPCWLWTGPRNKDGYAKFTLNDWPYQVHRVAYEWEVGPIPDGLTLDHLCRVTYCVRPSHLEPVTRGENTRRMHAARTHCKYGHEFTRENTIEREDGRVCRECKRRTDREAKRRSRRAPQPSASYL